MCRTHIGIDWVWNKACKRDVHISIKTGKKPAAAGNIRPASLPSRNAVKHKTRLSLTSYRNRQLIPLTKNSWHFNFSPTHSRECAWREVLARWVILLRDPPPGGECKPLARGPWHVGDFTSGPSTRGRV